MVVVCWSPVQPDTSLQRESALSSARLLSLKASEQGSSRRDLLLKTAKRALLIFLVGLALHSFPWWGYDYAHVRIPGVLQRIAIAYATALLGGLAGTWMRSDRASLDKVAGLFVLGSAGVVLGLAWGESFPINKNLWTSSYVLFTAGLAAHLLALCSSQSSTCPGSSRSTHRCCSRSPMCCSGSPSCRSSMARGFSSDCDIS